MDATPEVIMQLPDGALLLVYSNGHAWRLERDGAQIASDAAGVPLDAVSERRISMRSLFIHRVDPLVDPFSCSADPTPRVPPAF